MKDKAEVGLAKHRHQPASSSQLPNRKSGITVILAHQIDDSNNPVNKQ